MPLTNLVTVSPLFEVLQGGYGCYWLGSSLPNVGDRDAVLHLLRHPSRSLWRTERRTKPLNFNRRIDT
jgi:hypothetical protein